LEGVHRRADRRRRKTRFYHRGRDDSRSARSRRLFGARGMI
jgi:hypothetical protein